MRALPAPSAVLCPAGSAALWRIAGKWVYDANKSSTVGVQDCRLCNVKHECGAGSVALLNYQLSVCTDI